MGVEQKQRQSNPVLAHILQELQGARTVLDVGCGSGRLARALVRAGFDVTGIDPQPLNQAREICPDAHFIEASAAAMPFDAGSFDAVVFLNSLHHIPAKVMKEALSEAARCLVDKGRLIVIEPLAEGPLFEIVRIVDDETVVRNLAQAALDDCDLPAIRDLTFDRADRYDDAATFLSRLIEAEPARTTAIDLARETMNAKFDKYAKRDGNSFLLSQPMRIRTFRR
ncbi:MAG: class I SAM-dependent methyltransferase [Pseudorhodobacter sp.]